MSKENKKQKVTRLRIALTDDNTHRQIWVLRGKRTRIIITLASAFIILLLIVFSITAFTPLRRLIPGYPDQRSERQARNNALLIDSLESVVSRWDFYAENLRRIAEGADPVAIDSLIHDFSAEEPAADEEKLRRSDSLLRATVTAADKFGLRADNRKVPIEGMHFFTPVKGVVTEPFDKDIHRMAEINAPANSVIMAVLDGTVIYVHWSDENKYTIAVQHDNDLVSILSGAGKVMTAPGARVKAGAAIGMLGAVGEEKGKLKVELWYKGEAVDPAAYINF